MSRNDSTGPAPHQVAKKSSGALVSTATKWLRTSREFGWPILCLYAVVPLEHLDFHASYKILFLLGCPALLGGLVLRLWSHGYEVATSPGWVVEGPYRYVRNPVQLGALLAYAGGAVVLGVPWTWNVALCASAWVYLSAARLMTERFLFEKWGAAYLRYSQRVRLWIPSPIPAANRSGVSYSLLTALRRERRSLMWVGGYLLVYALRRHLGHG